MDMNTVEVTFTDVETQEQFKLQLSPSSGLRAQNGKLLSKYKNMLNGRLWFDDLDDLLIYSCFQ